MIAAPPLYSSAPVVGKPWVFRPLTMRGATATDPATSGPGRAVSSAEVRPRRPDYRGEELDPERGPGLGCFWFQVIVLGFFIVLIPIGLELNWPFELLAFLLFVVIGLLLLTGQSVIFLLRLVAADRRAQGRRRPLASSTKTVGELEDEQGVAVADPARDADSMIPEGGVAATPATDPDAPGVSALPVADVDAAGQAVTRGRRRDQQSRDVPADALWGIHTLRAVENFPLAGRPVHRLASRGG